MQNYITKLFFTAYVVHLDILTAECQPRCLTSGRFSILNEVLVVLASLLQKTLTYNVQCSFRCFESAAESYIKVPFIGAVSYLTLAVSPFCITFAVLWAVFRRVSFAWIGQDILVRISPTIYLVFFLSFNSPLLSDSITNTASFVLTHGNL